MNGGLIVVPSPDLLPAPLFAPTPKAAKRVLEFFTAQVNNDHTRKAYLNATRRFATWGSTLKPSKFLEAFDSGFALGILVLGHAISTDFPENDARRTSSDCPRAMVFRDQGSATLPKMGLFGNVRVGRPELTKRPSWHA
jgi:hypothetical protein